MSICKGGDKMYSCPICGSPVVYEISNETWQCMDCGYIFYEEECE